MRYYLILLLFGITWPVLGQHDTIAFGSGNLAESDFIAEAVNASDGVYTTFVLIRWQARDKGGNYRLFRANSSSGASLIELTKTWQKSNWFCDYSAEKDRDYYYAVMESDGNTSTALSKFDKGFLKKAMPIADVPALSATTPDKYAAGKVIFMLVADLNLDSLTYASGSQIPLQIGLQNIFEEPAARTDLRVYLSNDTTWDFADSLLVAKSYSGFPANFKGVLDEKVMLPSDLLPGKYHLIVVTAPEGSILNAKTGNVPVNIK